MATKDSTTNQPALVPVPPALRAGMPPEQRVLAHIARHAQAMKWVYGPVAPNTKTGLSHIRLSLVKEGMTVEQVTKATFQHFIDAGYSSDTAANEALKV